MFEKLEKLRAKPPHIKKRIALGTSAGITFVIVIFWITSLGISANQALATDGTSGNGSDASGQSAQTPSPISALTASVSDAFTPVAAVFTSLISDLSSAAHPAATSSAVEIYAAPMETTH